MTTHDAKSGPPTNPAESVGSRSVANGNPPRSGAGARGGMAAGPTDRFHLLNAMRSSSTLEEAAARLSIDVPTLEAWAGREHYGARLAILRGRGRPAHPGYKPFEPGQLLHDGALEVVRRAKNSPQGNARWTVRHVACGHEETVPAIQLRAYTKAGHVRRCRPCRETVRLAKARPRAGVIG